LKHYNIEAFFSKGSAEDELNDGAAKFMKTRLMRAEIAFIEMNVWD